MTVDADTSAVARVRASGGRGEETRERLLEAATELFATRGFRDTSVRQIIETAGVSNGAAVGYYFGTKEQLQTAVLERVLEPALREFHAALGELVARREPPSLDQIVRSWVRPIVRLQRSEHGRLTTRLLTQHLTEPGLITLTNIAPTALEDVIATFRQLMYDALPEDVRPMLPWRAAAALGSVVAFIMGLVDLDDREEDAAVDELSRYLVAGFTVEPVR